MDFFYGDQSEFFSFYRIPKALITEKQFENLFCEAKLLCGLLIDRMSLSKKNEWMDKQKRVYIYYTIEKIMEDLGCGHRKAGKLLSDWRSTSYFTKSDRDWVNRTVCIRFSS